MICRLLDSKGQELYLSVQLHFKNYKISLAKAQEQFTNSFLCGNNGGLIIDTKWLCEE